MIYEGFIFYSYIIYKFHFVIQFVTQLYPQRFGWSTHAGHFRKKKQSPKKVTESQVHPGISDDISSISGAFSVGFQKDVRSFTIYGSIPKNLLKLTTKSNDKTHLDQGGTKDSHPFNLGSCQASGPTSV